MKRIVLFVEGEGDEDAVPKLVSRLLTEQNAWDVVFLDERTFRVGQVNKLVKDDYREWKRKLAASMKRANVGAVLLLLDGDIKKVQGREFCAAEVARELGNASVEAGGGATFSVGIVFARHEYESWLIAGIESMAGKHLSDSRAIASDAKAPDGDLETSPTGAKAWLNNVIQGGYKPTRDQGELSDKLNWEMVRKREMRSFRRLESALAKLIEAIRNDQPVVTPS